MLKEDSEKDLKMNVKISKRINALVNNPLPDEIKEDILVELESLTMICKQNDIMFPDTIELIYAFIDSFAARSIETNNYTQGVINVITKKMEIDIAFTQNNKF